MKLDKVRERAPSAGRRRRRSVGQPSFRSALGLVLLVLGVLFGLAASACSPSRAVLLEAACEGGDANACEVLGAMYLLGEGVPKDEAKSAGYGRRALTLRSKACSEGDRDACARLGMAIASVPLDLPKPPGDSGAALVFAVILPSDGGMFVNDQPVATDDALLALARDAAAKEPELRAVIRADQSVQHGRVIRVLDILKQAGISKIAFGVSPAASAAPP